MKRFFSLILMVMMLFGVACGEETKPAIDLDKMTLAEIKELYVDLSSRLYVEALIKGCSIPLGDYVVGKEIPSGTYVVKIQLKDKDGWVRVYVWGTDGEIVDSESTIVTKDREYAKITLEDGERLHLQGSGDNTSVLPFIQLMIPFLMGQ